MLRERWPESYRNFQLARDALTRDFCSGEHGAVRVKVLAEWDTVSAMGLLRGNSLSFVGNKVPGNVDNAFLAVSLHEKRNMFQPMLWDSKENRGTKTNIKQCIFAGCHSDIGGGNADPALSAASFFWMIGQINGCCKADFSHESTTFQYVTPLQVEKSWWAWNRPPVGLHIQSFAEGRSSTRSIPLSLSQDLVYMCAKPITHPQAGSTNRVAGGGLSPIGCFCPYGTANATRSGRNF